jgi:hypothetical protein
MTMADQNWAFITAAYVVTWAVIVGYLVRVHRALARARADYQRVTGKTAAGAP